MVISGISSGSNKKLNGDELWSKEGNTMGKVWSKAQPTWSLTYESTGTIYNCWKKIKLEGRRARKV